VSSAAISSTSCVLCSGVRERCMPTLVSRSSPSHPPIRPTVAAALLTDGAPDARGRTPDGGRPFRVVSATVPPTVDRPVAGPAGDGYARAALSVRVGTTEPRYPGRPMGLFGAPKRCVCTGGLAPHLPVRQATGGNRFSTASSSVGAPRRVRERSAL
jgi:hypothetical protein